MSTSTIDDSDRRAVRGRRSEDTSKQNTVIHIAGGGAPEAADGSQDLNISGFTRIIKQQWLLVAMITALTMLVAFSYVMTATTRYTASSKILINPQPKRVFGSDYIPQDGNTNQILIESQTRVIASSAVLSRVVESENLIVDPEFSDTETGIMSWLMRLVGMNAAPGSGSSTEDKKLEALRRLHEKLSVKRPAQTYVIEVTVNSRNAEKAAMLSRAIAKAYIIDQSETQADSTRQISSLLEDRLANLRAKVLEADTKVQLFKKKHDIVAAEGSLVNERHLSRLNDELLAAKNRMATAGAKADKVQSLIASGAIPENFDEAIKSRLIASLREQYAVTSRRESQLASVYGDRHPQLVAARARVARSKNLINAELKRIAQTLQADFEVEKKRYSSLDQRLNKSRNITDTTNKARVELASLEREANASHIVYERVLAKARESSAQEKINLIDARIISEAQTPLWASWPKKKIIFPLALLMGLGLGLAAALVNDLRHDRFTSAADVEKMMDLRILGSIPSFVRGRVSLLKALFGKHEAGPREQGSYYRLYVELSKVGSPYASAVMGLVRNLTKLRHSQPHHSVMLVSSRAREGSSSIAWSVAISAAIQKRNVLLIDGDRADSELSETLSPNNREALRDVLAGKAKLSDLIVDDKDLGLSFLPIVAADDKKQPIDWSEYQSLMTQLPALFEKYELVVVDGGAILNSGLAHLLVDVVDSVALVVRTDGTSRRIVQEATRAFNIPARKLRGVIVSTVDPEMI
jgi:polysaccharide biosynthesis transport protein